MSLRDSGAIRGKREAPLSLTGIDYQEKPELSVVPINCVTKEH
jgi:hypothetical protein